MVIVFQLPLNLPNTPSVVQLLGLAPSAATACESQSLLPDVVNAAASSSSDAVKQELTHQVPVTSMNESPVVDSMLSLPSSLDVTNTVSPVFPAEASESAVRQVLHQEAGGSGDADSSSLVKGNDANAGSMLYAPAGLLHTGGGDDLGMSQVALLSSQTEAQLQELFRQQQWHIRLNQMMQLDVMQQQQQSQAPVVIGADTAASLLWHQQQQQHIANPTTVSFAFCNDQITQQQQQVLLQQQQQPQATAEMKYETTQQQTKPAAEYGQSPRQQKPRLIARGN